MTKQEQPILDVELQNQINIGLAYIQTIPGNVPFFEEHLVRQTIGYTLPEWNQLRPMERAYEIAVFRLKRAAENHFADAEIQKAKQKSRQR